MATPLRGEARGTKRSVGDGYANSIEDDEENLHAEASDSGSDGNGSEFDVLYALDAVEDRSRYHPDAPETEVQIFAPSIIPPLTNHRKHPNATSTSTSSPAPAPPAVPAKAAVETVLLLPMGRILWS